MAAGIVHRKVSAVADGGNASLIQPSNWNDTHTISGQARGDLVIGNSAGELDRLGIGASGTMLRSDGADPSWSANLLLTGYGRFGSASAPSNTTAGDLTIVRLFSPTISMSPTNASGATGTITSTTHATKGHVYIGASTLFDFDEVNGQLLIPTVGSGAGLLLGGDAQIYRGAADVLYSPDSARLAGHARIGSTSAPTNTTAGDLTIVRLIVGDAALGTGVEAAVTGDATISGFGRVGSASAPTNTSAGDFTAGTIFAATYYGSITNASAGTLTLSGTSHATKGFVYIGSSSLFAFDEANGRLGIGIAAPAAKLDVAFAFGTAIGTAHLGARMVDTTAQAAGVGGAISFAGYYDGSNSIGHFAVIKGYKLNSTSGVFTGGLQFGVQDGSSINEVARAFPVSGGGIWQIGGAYNPTDTGQHLELGKSVAAGTRYFPLVLRNNTAGAADLQAGIRFQTNNSSARYGAGIFGRNDGVTGAGQLYFGNYNNDTWTTYMIVGEGGGLTIGSPTGGNKGDGTLNATAVYDDNVLLTDHVFDAYLDGDLELANYNQRLRPWVSEFDQAWLRPDSYIGFWRANRRLPLMHDSLDSRGSLGEQVNSLTLNAELLAIHLEQALDRIALLEGRN